jgi:hypothetical protein
MEKPQSIFVIPAQAGIQKILKKPSGFRVKPGKTGMLVFFYNRFSIFHYFGKDQ